MFSASNWAIDPASPEKVHQAQLGMRYPPPRLAHDAIADSVIDQRTIYHFYSKSAWTLIDTEDSIATGVSGEYQRCGDTHDPPPQC